MTNRIRKCIAAATLAVSLGGGGVLLAANTHMIASTADAGMPWDTCGLQLKGDTCTQK